MNGLLFRAMMVAACGSYLSVTQPSLATVEPGDVVYISLWHDVLLAPEPGVGHAVISIGGDVIWGEIFTIPSYPRAYATNVVMEKSYLEGTPIVFDLHNHGNNNWRLLTVSRAECGI